STRSLQGLESFICACVRRLIFAVLRAVGVFCRIYCVIVGIVWGFIFSHDLLLVQLVVQVRYCNRSGVAVCPYRFILHNSGAHHIVPREFSMRYYDTPKLSGFTVSITRPAIAPTLVPLRRMYSRSLPTISSILSAASSAAQRPMVSEIIVVTSEA